MGLTVGFVAELDRMEAVNLINRLGCGRDGVREVVKSTIEAYGHFPIVGACQGHKGRPERKRAWRISSVSHCISDLLARGSIVGSSVPVHHVSSNTTSDNINHTVSFLRF